MTTRERLLTLNEIVCIQWNQTGQQVSYKLSEMHNGGWDGRTWHLRLDQGSWPSEEQLIKALTQRCRGILTHIYLGYRTNNAHRMKRGKRVAHLWVSAGPMD